MIDARISVRISATPFDPHAELAAFGERCAGAGAIVTFLGRVRDDCGPGTALSLEHYPDFTEREIEKFAAAAVSRWPLIGAAIVHRVGALAAREPIVLVAAAAAHRRDAFEAVDFLTDYLKSEAPFWKLERSGGERRWIEPRTQDLIDKARWRAAE